jgi:hypothetical protein
MYAAITRSPAERVWTIAPGRASKHGGGVTARLALAPAAGRRWLHAARHRARRLGARRIAQPIASLSTAAAILLRGGRIPPGRPPSWK